MPCDPVRSPERYGFVGLKEFERRLLFVLELC